MKTINIQWGFDGGKEVGLPNEMNIPEDISDEEEISDYCYECGGYGNDYFVNDDGELECLCPECPLNPLNHDGDF